MPRVAKKKAVKGKVIKRWHGSPLEKSPYIKEVTKIWKENSDHYHVAGFLRGAAMVGYNDPIFEELMFLYRIKRILGGDK